MISIRPEWYPSRTNKKLQAYSVGSFKVRQRIGLNAYVFYLPLDFGISFTFNIKSLIAYKKSHPISNDLFEMPLNPTPDDPIKTSTLFTMILSQKDNIDAILDEQVVFIREGEVQQFLVYWVGRPNSNCT